MKSTNTSLKKTLIFVTIFIVIAGLVSPISKYIIERYDEQFIGRQIKTGWLFINPFTGFIYIRNLKIYEHKSSPDLIEYDSVFFSAKGVSANFAMLKMLLKTIEISSITLNQPKGVIIQNNKEFNFSDLIKKFTPAKSDTTPSRFQFNILAIIIKNGTFYYHEKAIPVNYSVKEVNIESAGKQWNDDTIAVKFSFLSGTGSGSITGKITINFKNQDYSVDAIVNNFDLKFIEQYLKDLVNFGNFGANLDADIKATGNLNDGENLNAKGLLQMNDFHIGKNQDDDYASFDKLVFKIDELNPKGHQYLFDTLSITHPYFKYEHYDYLDNIQRMFGKKGANILEAKADPAKFNLILEIADYVKVLAKNFFKSDYKINKLAIYDGNFKFNDYSHIEKFSIEVNPFYIVADSVNKNRNRVVIFFKSEIQPYSNMAVTLSINPNESGDFDMQYHLQSLPLSMFNPYLIAFTSYPLDRGTLELNGNWKVKNNIITSDNHLLVIDPRVANRLKNKDTKWVPSSLIMFFIREHGNVIDYEIPITGSLKDPKFHLKDIIFDILGNIFVKPTTAPYRTQVKNIENEIEKSLTLKWEMRVSSLQPDQELFVNKLVDFLINNPEASIDVYPLQYAEKEKEYILFFEAKKKYFLLTREISTQFLSENDSLKLDKMSVKDSSFVHYLNKQVNDTLLFTIQEKCNSYIGKALIDTKFKQLTTNREGAFMLHFKEKDVENQVRIFDGENQIPYNGFSFYKIVYKGEIPEALVKAYQKMNEFNDEAPRKRFVKEREKNTRLQE